MRLNASEGSYAVSFFYMTIETPDDLSVKIIEKHEQTFVHEYIHFLQDIFLSYNLRQQLIELKKIFSIMERAKLFWITLPYTDSDDEVVLLERQTEYTFGLFHVINLERNIINIDIDYFLNPGTNASIKKYIATLDSGERYQLGALDMLEYIAFKIESKHWEVSAPYFPYQTMEKVFKYLEIECIPDECKIAITEFCLHNDNPINQLFVLIDLLKNNGYIDKLSAYDTVNEMLLSMRWNSTGGFSETIKTKLSRRITDLKENLLKKYDHHYFKDIYRWIDDLIRYVENNFVNILFFSDLYIKNHNDFIIKINDIIKEIGIPLIFNSKNDCISATPEKYDQNQFLQFYISSKFINFTKGNNLTCPIMSFCENASPNIITNDCFNNCISRAYGENLCPLGQYIAVNKLFKIKQ